MGGGTQDAEYWSSVDYDAGIHHFWISRYCLARTEFGRTYLRTVPRGFCDASMKAIHSSMEARETWKHSSLPSVGVTDGSNEIGQSVRETRRPSWRVVAGATTWSNGVHVPLPAKTRRGVVAA